MASNHSMKIGEVAIGNNYSLIRIIVHKRGVEYLPYIAGCLVEGPKGGIYLLDTFGYEQLIKSIQAKLEAINAGSIGTAVMNNIENLRRISYNAAIVNNKALLNGNTNEECCASYAKAYGFKFIKRKDVPVFIERINR